MTAYPAAYPSQVYLKSVSGESVNPDDLVFERPLAELPEGWMAPHPVRRFLARVIDFTLYMLVWMLLSVAVVALLSQFMAYETAVEIGSYLQMSSMFGSWIVVEGLFFQLFGTTPGKAWLRISVLNADGTVLNSRQGVIRAFWVLVKGLGLGIPVLSWIFMGFAGYKLKQTGQTSWDRDGEYVVVQQPMSPLRWVTAGLYLAMVLCFRIAATVGGLLTL